MAGFILIIIGAIFLLRNLGFIPGNAWEVIWPALLIAAGLSFVMRKSRAAFFWGSLERCFFCGRKKSEDKNYDIQTH